jgi:hypothetical protein
LGVYQFATSQSTWKPNFAQIGGFLYLAVILYLGYQGNGRHFEFFFNPQKLPHTMVDIPTNFQLDESFQKFCLTCVHIILRLRNFRMAAVATKNVKNLKCSELDET